MLAVEATLIPTVQLGVSLSSSLQRQRPFHQPPVAPGGRQRQPLGVQGHAGEHHVPHHVPARNHAGDPPGALQGSAAASGPVGPAAGAASTSLTHMHWWKLFCSHVIWPLNPPVQALIDLGCVTEKTLVKRPKPSLFSRPARVVAPAGAKAQAVEPEQVYYEPTMSCCLRLSQVLPNEDNWNLCQPWGSSLVASGCNRNVGWLIMTEIQSKLHHHWGNVVASEQRCFQVLYNNILDHVALSNALHLSL